MRLDFVEICGFRGFREKVRVDFGSGFTIITGRNGVGKSTLCDAVEFALTGSIEKYTIERASQERFGDYLWWRGDGSPIDHYVTVAFKKEDGEVFCIKRARGLEADKSQIEIENALCHSDRPDDALRRLCKSSIIRDEWISALSLDLTDIKRFELVESALGPVQKFDLGAKAKDVLKGIESAHKENQKTYDNTRAQLADALTRLTEAKKTIEQLGDVSAAKEVLDSAISDNSEDIAGHISSGRSALAEGRMHLRSMDELVTQSRELQSLRRSFDDLNAVQRRKAARDRLDAAEESRVNADRFVMEMARILELEERSSELAVSLAAIVEHGEKFGLHEEHCPLCASKRTNEEFAAGLELARQRMKTLSNSVSRAREQAEKARDAAQQATTKQEQAQAEWVEIEKEQYRLIAQEKALIEMFEHNELDVSFTQDPDGFKQYLRSERDRLINLERALHTLEASQIVSNITSIEESIARYRKEVDGAAAQLEKSQRALESAKAMDRSVSSISGEIIDERLAQITPLLKELYQRLRPHHDWRSIEYNVRGDVRRFLSLNVGDGLNPQFIFSSGQRRAAGLAFLLSVYLARAWTPWHTLILDDPVQHIDDFRAIHLVEVLAAFCFAGRQIVCAVEDSALADVLCRRLPSTSDALGKRYDIDIGVNGVATILSEKEIFPMPVGVIRSGSEISVVD